MAKKIVLAGACRTAIGTMGGALSTVPAAELGAIVIREALKRAGVAPEKVDQDRKSTRQNSSHIRRSRMPSSA